MTDFDPDQPFTSGPPATLDDHIAAASQRYGVPEPLIRGVIGQESDFDPTSVSSAGARGLMQSMPGTYQEISQKEGLGSDIFHPYNNIMAGTAYLRQMIDRYNGDQDLGLKAYNGGPKTVDDWIAGKRNLPKETQDYASAVMRRVPSSVDVASVGMSDAPAGYIPDQGFDPSQPFTSSEPQAQFDPSQPFMAFDPSQPFTTEEPSSGILSSIGQFAKGIPAGFVQGVASAGRGLTEAADVAARRLTGSEFPNYGVGQAITSAEQQATSALPKPQGAAGELGQTVGNLGSGFVATLLNPIAGLGVFGAQGFDTGIQAAKAKGAPQGAGDLAALANAGTNMLMGLIPAGKLAFLERLAPETSSAILGYAMKTVDAGIAGAGLGAVGQAIDDAVSKYTYDPDRVIGEGLAHSATMTGLAAAILHGTVGQIHRGQEPKSVNEPEGQTATDGTEAPPSQLQTLLSQEEDRTALDKMLEEKPPDQVEALPTEGSEDQLTQFDPAKPFTAEAGSPFEQMLSRERADAIAQEITPEEVDKYQDFQRRHAKPFTAEVQGAPDEIPEPSGSVRTQLASNAYSLNHPDNADLREAVARTVSDQIGRIIGDNGAVKVHDAMYLSDGTPMVGGYLDQLIHVALNDPRTGQPRTDQTIAGTVRHEAIHFLKDIGAIDDRSWKTLMDQADNWRDQFKVDDRYPGLSDDQKREEAIADAYAAWARPSGFGAYLPAIVRQAFAKMAQVYQSVRSSVRGIIGANPDSRDIFSAIERGDFANRALASAQGEGDMQAMRPLQWAQTTDAWKSVADAAEKVKNDLLMKTTPMALGSVEARASAEAFANTIRRIQNRFGGIDQELTKKYNAAQRKAMFEATAEQSVFEQMLGQEKAEQARQGVPPQDISAYEAQQRQLWAGRGLDRLSAGQRADVDAMNNLSQRTWDQLRQAGLVHLQAEGLPYYVPYSFVSVSPEGKVTRVGSNDTGGGVTAMTPIGRNLNTNGPGRRSHLLADDSEAAAKAKLGQDTKMVRDIRTLPVMLARNQRAIAGAKLVDVIKSLSKLGAETVKAGAVPKSDERNFFTLDHPALKTYQVKLDANGNAVKDQSGNPVMERVPLYISKEFEGPLRAVLSQDTGPLFNALMRLKFGSVGAIMYSPAIHNMVEFGRAFPLMPGKMATLQVYRDGSQVLGDRHQMAEAIDAGMVPIGSHWRSDIVGIANEAINGPDRGMPTKIVQKLLGDRSADAVEKLGKFWHQTLLWDQVAKLQAGIYSNMRDRYMVNGYDRETANRMAAHLANRYAGALPREAMSDAANKLAHLAFFSRSFTFGNLGVMKDMLSGAPKYVLDSMDKLNRAGAQSALKRKAIGAFLLDLGLFYAANSIAQNAFQLWNGESPDDVANGYVRRMRNMLGNAYEHPLQAAVNALNPFDTIEKLTPQGENEPGKHDRIWMGNDSSGRGLYLRNPFGKIGEEFKGWLTEPIQMLKRKGSQYTHAAAGLWANDQGFGHPIYDTEDRTMIGALKAAGNIVGYTMKQFLPVQAIEGASRALEGGPSASISGAKAALPLIGLSLSQGHPLGPEAGAQAEVLRNAQKSRMEAVPQARRLMELGKADEASAVLANAGVSPKEATGILRGFQNPDRSRQRMQRQFNRKAGDDDRSRLDYVTGGTR